MKIEEPEGGRVPAREKKASTEESLEDLKL
jgi:hypothetical protein